MISIRYSEANDFLDCMARWDFRHRGVRVGYPLKPKIMSNRLYDGSAFGQGAAEWHATGDKDKAFAKVAEYYTKHIKHLEDNKIAFDPEDQAEQVAAVFASLNMHMEKAPFLKGFYEPELELEYFQNFRYNDREETIRFIGHVDGLWMDEDKNLWIVEFKRRKSFTEMWLVYFFRQLRWYTYFATGMLKTRVAGVLYDETLNEIYSPLRFTNSGNVDKRGTYDADQYVKWCADNDKLVDPELLLKCQAKTYHRRMFVQFTDTEMYDTARELEELAPIMLDAYENERYAFRNPNTNRCPGCSFRDICFSGNYTLVQEMFTKAELHDLADA